VPGGPSHDAAMPWEYVVSHVLLPSLVAAAALMGAWRCARLLRYGRDPRLAKLLWFYGLFAASLVAYAVWTGEIAHTAGQELGQGHEGDGRHGGEEVHQAFARAERVDVFLLSHHVLMLASLGVAVAAFHHGRAGGATAAVGFAFAAPFVPVVLALEAAMTLYLAVQAFLNHLERRTPGALQVAAGFLLFFLGHLGFFVFHQPGAARTPVGDMFALVGIVLLVQLLPRPRA